MQYRSKGVDEQKKKIINGVYSEYANNNTANNNATSCQKFSFTRDKGRKGLNTQNNKNKHVDYKKGTSNKSKTGNDNWAC